MSFNYLPKRQGLYDPSNEHDACGIGAVINIKGEKSHDIIVEALEILTNLKHRGGTGAEDNTGDGAGILTQIPHAFFASQNLEFNLEENNYAIAQMFLSRNKEKRNRSLNIFEEVIKEENVELLGYREVPTNARELGKTASIARPYILQAFVKKPKTIKEELEFERLLYVIRRQTEKKIQEKDDFYFCSFSSKTIVYKGMLLATQVNNFYLDLQNSLFTSAIALVHSRFSTNTFPSWERAHPNRFVVHNGEINTIRGNIDSIKARESLFHSDKLNLNKVLPVIDKESSDSAMFDNTLEFLYLSGYSLTQILMMMIPEPWSKDKAMEENKKAFYEYSSMLMEPWDGPASIISTDGNIVVASLDRNGLRPSRYYLTKDDKLILASEVGSFEIKEENVKLKSRLEPGKILVVDTIEKRVISDEEIKGKIAKETNYKKYLNNLLKLENVETKGFIESHYDEAMCLIKQTSFGYKYDAIEQGILPMAQNGEEKIVSMGHDVPIAVLSKRHPLLYSYFKQLFAQVTNPPIDCIREDCVTSTRIYIGAEGDLLNPNEDNAKRVKVCRSIISNEELFKIKSLKEYGFNSKTIDILFDEKETLEEALLRISLETKEAINNGNTIIILSDRKEDINHVAIPSLLAVSAVHTYLVKESLRTKASLVIESAEASEIHHYACLIGFGATLVNPYGVYETIYDLINKGQIKDTYEHAQYNYIKASMKGIVKIISKMGISTVQAYNGACIFEALGLSKKLIDAYFMGVSSPIEGIDINDIEKETRQRHDKAYHDILIALDSEGTHGLRNGKEEHLYNPFTIYKLQQACRNNDYSLFKEFSKEINNKTNNIRDLMDFNLNHEISIDEVESADSIVKRFKTGAMSYGSISEEAHECMAIAMNRIGGKSNTGEGGELTKRYLPLENGDSLASAITQVASGRFGVTMEYLVKAKEIQIKMAQGAKPGEGGQLPAQKVYPWVAEARHSTPGVSLISPPPHHDIYSIEDLAQLIYDLKNANRDVRISVKLVSEKGIGTVASGVAKAGANVILISSYDGGTGASPRTSITNAGMPWEIGLADAHQTLILNNLRDRVALEVDGKLLTGRDLAIAALLGADEFGFATAPLIAMGCVMMRVCNLDTCPVGIATQNEKLRKNFKGKPEYVINFMYFIANELREYMALLGFRTLNEMIGRTDLLKKKKESKIDLSSIIHNSIVFNKTNVHFQKIKEVDFSDTLDEAILLPICEKALNRQEKVCFDMKIDNTNRTFGTILSSEIVKKYGRKGLKDDTICINTYGHAGNSLGAFGANGLTITVSGDTNDYLGKGLCGAIIAVKLDKKASLKANENIIIGNVALYGATSGKVFLDGLAGERFCVRNSGAIAVSLGVGQHGCEYMTGGIALILGKIGRNFAAGMSGGVAYVLNNENNLNNINKGLVDIMDIDDKDEEVILGLIKEHIARTDSLVSSLYLKEYDRSKYVKVMPKDYYKIMKIKERLLKSYSPEEATLKSFYEAMEVK